MPVGHAVNANLAMVSNFSVHHDRDEAIRRGQEGFEFFGYAVNALVAHDATPGRSRLFSDFQASRARSDGRRSASASCAARRATPTASATPGDIRDHIRDFQTAGVDQVIFLQQAGRNKHEHILRVAPRSCSPPRCWASLKAEVAEREARKAEELAPFIAAAMARKQWTKPLADDEIPVVKASVARAITAASS